MNTFSLKVIACDRVFFDGRCEQVVLPLHDGEKAIQAHHENMVFAVEIGEIRITDETGEEIVGVTGTGFAQIINNRAMVIVDTCESPEEIDVRRAEEAKERAQEQLRQKQSIQEYYRSKASLARAMSRLKVGKKTVRPDIKKKNGLVQGSGGSERENVSPDPPGPCYARVEEKGLFAGLGMKNQPVRPEKKLISGLGEKKECRQTRRKPKCSHVSQKNRRLYAKTGHREKVLCRPVLIVCTTSANND